MNGVKALGLAAVGAFMMLAAPVERAQAVSLINPGAAATVQEDAKVTTEVRWHHGWHHHRGWHRGWHRRHWHRHYWHRHWR